MSFVQVRWFSVMFAVRKSLERKGHSQQVGWPFVESTKLSYDILTRDGFRNRCRCDEPNHTLLWFSRAIGQPLSDPLERNYRCVIFARPVSRELLNLLDYELDGLLRRFASTIQEHPNEPFLTKELSSLTGLD
jgi:hypothetical protein